MRVSAGLSISSARVKPSLCQLPPAPCPLIHAGLSIFSIHGYVIYQVISNTGFESPCSTNGESCRFSPLWSNGPRLHGGNPIGPSTLLRMVSLSNHFVPASRGGVYIESMIYVSYRNILKLLINNTVTPHSWPAYSNQAGRLIRFHEVYIFNL